MTEPDRFFRAQWNRSRGTYIHYWWDNYRRSSDYINFDSIINTAKRDILNNQIGGYMQRTGMASLSQAQFTKDEKVAIEAALSGKDIDWSKLDETGETRQKNVADYQLISATDSVASLSNDILKLTTQLNNINSLLKEIQNFGNQMKQEENVLYRGVMEYVKQQGDLGISESEVFQNIQNFYLSQPDGTMFGKDSTGVLSGAKKAAQKLILIAAGIVEGEIDTSSAQTLLQSFANKTEKQWQDIGTSLNEFAGETGLVMTSNVISKATNLFHTDINSQLVGLGTSTGGLITGQLDTSSQIKWIAERADSVVGGGLLKYDGEFATAFSDTTSKADGAVGTVSATINGAGFTNKTSLHNLIDPTKKIEEIKAVETTFLRLLLEYSSLSGPQIVAIMNVGAGHLVNGRYESGLTAKWDKLKEALFPWVIINALTGLNTTGANNYYIKINNKIIPLNTFIFNLSTGIAKGNVTGRISGSNKGQWPTRAQMTEATKIWQGATNTPSSSEGLIRSTLAYDKILSIWNDCKIRVRLNSFDLVSMAKAVPGGVTGII